jgi:stage II sporulation protein M
MSLPDIYSGSYLSEYADIAVNHYSLWKYILKYRLRDFLIICVVGLTVLRKYVFCIYLIYVGICMGLLISTSVMCYGFLGLGVFLLSVLPQYIFYGTALYLVYKLYFMQHIHLKTAGPVVIITLVLLLIGTYSESCLNPLILKWLYMVLY